MLAILDLLVAGLSGDVSIPEMRNATGAVVNDGAEQQICGSNVLQGGQDREGVSCANCSQGSSKGADGRM